MIGKAFIAEFFGVSRSAITQSTKKRNTTVELEIRLRRYMLGSKNMHNVGYSKDQLIKLARLLTTSRSTTDKKTGRPKQNVDFKVLRRMIYAIFKDICKTLGVVHTEDDIDFQFTIPFISKMQLLYTNEDDPLLC